MPRRFRARDDLRPAICVAGFNGSALGAVEVDPATRVQHLIVSGGLIVQLRTIAHARNGVPLVQTLENTIFTCRVRGAAHVTANIATAECLLNGHVGSAAVQPCGAAGEPHHHPRGNLLESATRRSPCDDGQHTPSSTPHQRR